MAFVVKKDNGTTLGKVLLIIVLIVVIVSVVYFVWYYGVRRYLDYQLLTPSHVLCTSAPASPTNLSGYLSNNRAYLMWSSVPNVDDYLVYVGTHVGFPTSAATRTITVVGNSVAVLNISPGIYYFKVAASNSCGTSAVSNEIILAETNVPSTFKLCKSDNPTYCLALSNPANPAFSSTTCANSSCDLTYINNANVKRANANLCLFETNPGGIVIENATLVNPCTGETDWTMDFTTGFISSADGLCLGADDVDGSASYNTTCSQIVNPTDARYVWTMQAASN